MIIALGLYKKGALTLLKHAQIHFEGINYHDILPLFWVIQLKIKKERKSNKAKKKKSRKTSLALAFLDILRLT